MYEESSLFSSEVEPFTNGIYVIAMVGNEEENYDEEADFKVIFQKADYRFFQDVNNQFKVHWLCGLIPKSRMYEACLLKPQIIFENEYIFNEDNQDEYYSDQIEVKSPIKLNTIQMKVVQEMLMDEADGP